MGPSLRGSAGGAVAIAAGVLILASSPDARADASAAEKKLAKDMLSEAITSEKAGKCDDAIDMLKQVIAIHESAEALLHYGECLSRTGHLLDAASTWEHADALAKEEKDRSIEGAVAPKLEEVRGRIPTVLLQIPAGVRAAIEIDHKPVPEERVAKAIRLDPGDHLIEATSEGRRPFSKQVKLAEKDAPVIPVLLPALIAAKVTPPEPPPPKRAGIPLGTWMAAGAAVLFTVGGVASFAGAGSAAADGRLQCGKVPRCDPGSKELVHELDGTALGLWIGAGVAAGAAVAVWALDRPRAKTKAEVHAAPPLRALVGPTGVRLEGVF